MQIVNAKRLDQTLYLHCNAEKPPDMTANVDWDVNRQFLQKDLKLTFFEQKSGYFTIVVIGSFHERGFPVIISDVNVTFL